MVKIIKGTKIYTSTYLTNAIRNTANEFDEVPQNGEELDNIEFFWRGLRGHNC